MLIDHSQGWQLHRLAEFRRPACNRNEESFLAGGQILGQTLAAVAGDRQRCAEDRGRNVRQVDAESPEFHL